ncbi:hypothetical protein TGCAST_312490 [Toxoplasma gondii CAST]|uniref:Uncharacterized protein n=1 Tax=Toxoplasma gondii CAST TaxID=943122 RepID=A0A425I1Q8_TOXGO|nr:hypothetical protein TGCAST_312490 [Toxoplasma gondii CAST]
MQSHPPAGGRGRHMVLPAWMTQGQNSGPSASPVNGAAPAIPCLPGAGCGASPRASGFSPAPVSALPGGHAVSGTPQPSGFSACTPAGPAPASGLSGTSSASAPNGAPRGLSSPPRGLSGTPRWMADGLRGRSRSERRSTADSRDGSEASRSRRGRDAEKRRSSASSRSSPDARRRSRRDRSRSSSADSRRHRRRDRDTSRGRGDSRRAKRRRSRSDASRSAERRHTHAESRRDDRRERRKTQSYRRNDQSRSEERRERSRRWRRSSRSSDYAATDDARASAATLADRILEVRQMPQAKRSSRRSDLLSLLATDEDFYAEDRYGKGYGRSSYVSEMILGEPDSTVRVNKRLLLEESERHSFSVDFEEHTGGRDQVVLYECANGKMVRVYCFRDSENLVREKLSLDELKKTRIYEKARKYCSRKGVPADAQHHYFDYVNNPEVLG